MRQLEHEGNEDQEGCQRVARVPTITRWVPPTSAVPVLIYLYLFVFLRALRGAMRFPG
jgi:hypothetical protein